MIVDSVIVPQASFETRTGWQIKPEGACKGDVCVPLPPEARSSDGLDIRVLGERLGMPLVAAEEHGLFALGPETGITGRALLTARAPDVELPDVDGNPFRLSSLRGRKVLLVAWASW